MTTCSIDGCEKRAKTRGWCNGHYECWRRTGDPIAVRARPLAERLAAIGWTVTSTGCWEWNGLRRRGYGLYSGQLVHRLMHELATGETPEVVRHTCDNPPCCRPDHLLSGTQSDNTRDMAERNRRYGKRTTCSNGHDLTVPGATREFVERSTGKRQVACFECRRAKARRYAARLKQQREAET